MEKKGEGVVMLTVTTYRPMTQWPGKISKHRPSSVCHYDCLSGNQQIAVFNKTKTKMCKKRSDQLVMEDKLPASSNALDLRYCVLPLKRSKKTAPFSPVTCVDVMWAINKADRQAGGRARTFRL